MSLTEQATRELAKINMGPEDTTAILGIMKAFFGHWDSGGAVSVMLPLLVRCMRGQPLTPLTGAEEEWTQPDPSLQLFQNSRCGTIFRERKDGGWRYFDCETGEEVTMPHMPETRVDVATVFEVHAREEVS